MPTLPNRCALSINDDGAILRTPLASIPKRELLVWENEELKASLFRGLADAAAGRTPSAWRPWWIYSDADEIIIGTIGPHP